MSELISGKEALIALANGGEVEMSDESVGMDWTSINKKGFLIEVSGCSPSLHVFFCEDKEVKFRLAPQTIKITIEVPAPFEPKEGEDCRCYYINTALKHGFDWYHSTHHESNRVAWRTESDIKQVVEALREVFK